MFRTLGIRLFNWLFPVRDGGTTFQESETVSNFGYINPTDDGRFALVRRGFGVVNTYTRARDARRGAARLGLVLA
jgi:hypothetical protein